MFNKKSGFTVAELLVVIFIIVGLSAVLAPFIIRSTSAVMVKTHAAADAATLRSTITNINIELLEDRGMKEIADHMAPANCETDPSADLWINYSKPITLDAYFVDGEKYYSIPYLSDIALNGSTELDLDEPFTLGFWYEAGSSE